jgi:hypothetical protein
MFTLDGVEYAYAASDLPGNHPWGQGESMPGVPYPYHYSLFASSSSADAADLVNSIVIEFSPDGDFYEGNVTIYDADGDAFSFELGDFTRADLEAAVENLDEVGSQMRGGFAGPLAYIGSGTHTLEKLAFSVERLEDLHPPL